MSDTTYAARRIEIETVAELADLPVTATPNVLFGEGDEHDTQAENERRARRSAELLLRYAEAHSSVDEPVDTTLGDLLADLRHLCDAIGADFDDEVERSRYNHDAEIAGVA